MPISEFFLLGKTNLMSWPFPQTTSHFIIIPRQISHLFALCWFGESKLSKSSSAKIEVHILLGLPFCALLALLASTVPNLSGNTETSFLFTYGLHAGEKKPGNKLLSGRNKLFIRSYQSKAIKSLSKRASAQ